MEKSKNGVKALAMLKTNTSVKERAENYIVSVKRNLQRDVIDTLTAKKEAMEDKLFELTDFSLETDINRGQAMMTKEMVEKRFTEVIETEYRLKLIKLELETKQATFDKYFA